VTNAKYETCGKKGSILRNGEGGKGVVFLVMQFSFLSHG